MGKGKGTFDHWAARVAVNKILFEIRGQVHEKVVRDAFRLAGNKLPGRSHHPSIICVGSSSNGPVGQYEFVRKGDPPVVGITKLDGVTLAELKRPWKELPEVQKTAPPAVPTGTLDAGPPPA